MNRREGGIEDGGTGPIRAEVQFRPRRLRQHVPAERLVLVHRLVALAFEIPVDALKAPTRQGAGIARARQVGMYLAHTAMGASLDAAARAFNRDRTTASHACHRVEDLREDPDFDALVGDLEAILRSARRPERTP